MLFSKTLFLGLVGSAAAASLSTAVSDLSQLSSILTTLKSDVDAYTGTGVPANIVTDAKSLQTALDTATSDVSSLSSLADSDQVTLLKAAQGTYPAMVSALSSIVSKLPLLQQAGLASTLNSALTTLETSADKLFGAITVQSTGDYQPVASNLSNAVNTAFGAALNGQTPALQTLSSIPAAGPAPVPVVTATQVGSSVGYAPLPTVTATQEGSSVAPPYVVTSTVEVIPTYAAPTTTAYETSPVYETSPAYSTYVAFTTAYTCACPVSTYISIYTPTAVLPTVTSYSTIYATVYSTSPTPVPVSSYVPTSAYVPPPIYSASSPLPPLYTGAANKLGPVGGVVLLAAAAFAL